MPGGDWHGGDAAVGRGARPTCHSERLLRPALSAASREESLLAMAARSEWLGATAGKDSSLELASQCCVAVTGAAWELERPPGHGPGYTLRARAVRNPHPGAGPGVGGAQHPAATPGRGQFLCLAQGCTSPGILRMTLTGTLSIPVDRSQASQRESEGDPYAPIATLAATGRPPAASAPLSQRSRKRYTSSRTVCGKLCPPGKMRARNCSATPARA